MPEASDWLSWDSYESALLSKLRRFEHFIVGDVSRPIVGSTRVRWRDRIVCQDGFELHIDQYQAVRLSHRRPEVKSIRYSYQVLLRRGTAIESLLRYDNFHLHPGLPMSTTSIAETLSNTLVRGISPRSLTCWPKQRRYGVRRGEAVCPKPLSPHNLIMPSAPPCHVLIDLGCGARKKAGAVGVDIARLPGVDVVADVFHPLPFRDCSVDEVYAAHVVEHVDDLMAFMGEIWRICKPDALVHFRFPHATTAYVIWKDPTHRRGVFLDTFDYFDPSTLDGRDFGYYHPAKFRIVKQKLRFNMDADRWLPGRKRRILGRLFDALANRSARAQFFCERFWGHLAGMEEAHIWMRAIK